MNERDIDLYEEIENPRTVTNAELLFDRLIGKNSTKKCETYSHRRKPLLLMSTNIPTNEKPIDSSPSDNESNNSRDTDFEPFPKTSRTKIKKIIDKRMNNKKSVKFAEICDKKVKKKSQTKKQTAYPDCTKESLLRAFESAGLPDYEEIAKIQLHTTHVRDAVRPDPPTPPMHEIMEPFNDLIDWTKEDLSSEERNVMLGSAKSNTNSSDWETEVSESQNDIFCENMDSISNQTVINVTKHKDLKICDKSQTKSQFRRESLKTAGLGSNRIASTPMRRKGHKDVTLKNVSPINSISSPEMSSELRTRNASKSKETFVAPLPPKYKLPKVTKISVPIEDQSLTNDLVDPSLSDLNKVTQFVVNPSKQLTRSLIDDSMSTIVCENSSSDELQTDIEKISNDGTNDYTLKSNSNRLKSLRNRTLQKSSELSSIFNPRVKSTPLVIPKQKSKNSNYELIVDRSHLDVSMAKIWRSNNTTILNDIPITTSIEPVLGSQEDSKTRKHSSNAYHLYRRSIASVQSIYNKSCQPLRAVIKTSQMNSTLNDRSCQEMRTVFRNQNDIKEFFHQSLSTSMFSSSKVVLNDGKQQVLTAKQKVLLYCEPKYVIEFKSAFDKNILSKCRKIGEGSYGEVFSSTDKEGNDVVIKIVPLIHNENQTEEDIFAQILPELVISLNFNRLKTDVLSNRAPNFIHMMKATTTQGLFPKKLIDEWDKYDKRRPNGSENEDPRTFNKQQLYIILYLANGGTDLESCQLKSSLESLSIFAQLALSLASAESCFQFEHRDLHWGNVLISGTTQTSLEYCVDDCHYSLNPNGVFASIIDFSLSRMTDNEFIIYDDLAKYSDLFEGSGDYQFDIYRLMREENGNNWQKFVPKTNIFWLRYLLDKTINSKKYTDCRKKAHKEIIQILKTIYDSILKFNSAKELIESKDFCKYVSPLKVVIN